MGVISPTYYQINITILTNDDPAGVLAFVTREVVVAEDFLPGQENTTETQLEIIREQGLYGDVSVSSCSSFAIHPILIAKCYILCWCVPEDSTMIFR